VLVQACLNGSRKPGEHPALPVTAAELAADAHRVAEAGAGALHVHPRGPDGSETLEAEACAAALGAIRHVRPGLPVGLSTGSWIEPDPNRRLERIAAWTERPDYASVNFSEPGAIELCDLLLRLGIGIEAGLWSSEEAEALVDSGRAHRLMRVLVEPMDDEPVAAVAAAERIGALLDHAEVEVPRLYHGRGRATWRVIEEALETGWDVRVGLEDTLELPDGSVALDNEQLVGAVISMARRRGL
jgi:uncharacterized protein (DUF849 family)